MNTIDKDIENKIIKLCIDEDIGITRISKRLNINKSIVKKVFLKNKIKSSIGYGAPLYKYTKKQILSILNDYKNGKSLSFISKKFNVSADVIKRILTENGVKNFRNCKEQQKAGLKYKFNEDYFSKINSHEKAYFLGLLFADGYNYHEKGRVSLSLQDRDSYILKDFWKDLGGNENIPIYTTDKNKYSGRKINGIEVVYNYNSDLLRLCSRKISNDLNTLGCFQAKSLILKFPSEEQVPIEYMNSFILGYFDGDGCVSTGKNSIFRSCSVNFVSSEFFIKSLKDFLQNELSINSWIRKTKRSYRLDFKKTDDVLKFYHFVYSKSKFFLRRKKDKFIEFFKNYKGIKI